MQVGRLCTRDIVSVNASTPVQEAARVMRNNHVGALVVTDIHDPAHAIGILTDRDLVVKMLAHENAEHPPTIDSLCSHHIVAVDAAAGVDDALRTMQQAQVRRIVVRGADGSLRGLLSVDDLLDAMASELEQLAKVMRGGVEREESRLREAFTGESLPSTAYLLDEVP